MVSILFGRWVEGELESGLEVVFRVVWGMALQIQSGDLETVMVKKRHQISFFTDKIELVGRKLKKNLKQGQILHPRHLFESFDINNGDIISIVSNLGNVSVTVSGEAQDSGNLGDLIEVKNLKSGKIIKGYIKKNKKIKIFR